MYSSLKINDQNTLQRVQLAETFKQYDGNLEGKVKKSLFSFVFRDLQSKKLISGKLNFDSVWERLHDEEEDVYFNDFMSWVRTVSGNYIVNSVL